MLLILLLIIPLIGTILVSTNSSVVSLPQTLGFSSRNTVITEENVKNLDEESLATNKTNGTITSIKQIGLLTSLINLFVSIVVFLLFNFSSNQYQFVQEYHSINNIDFYLGVDGISIYFVLLTTIIMPIAILSN